VQKTVELETKEKKQFDHAADAKRYATRVVSGKQHAGKFEILACKRFLKDLESKQYEFDKNAVNRCCRFLTLMPHVKGAKATQHFALSSWQRFIVANVIGFKDKFTGFRRFNRAIVFVARGNGKSFFSSALSIYMTFFDGEFGADTFSAATTREQAKIVWGTAQQMLRQMPELVKSAGITVEQNGIYQEKSNSVFKPVSSDASTMDGLNPYLVIIDELHCVTRALYDVMETAMSKRDQSLMLSISTAGFDTSSVGFELHAYGKRVLQEVTEDERLFILIYEADEEDILSEKAWEEANPNIDVSVNRKSLRDMAKKASTLSSFRNAFITRHLNRFVNTREAWMRLDKWAQCASNINIEDFERRPCVIGLDMSNRNDITSKCYVFTEQKDGQLHYTAFWKNYLPEVAVQESRNASYAGWVADGHITTTPGDSIDYAQVQEELIEDSQKFPQMEIASDPWNTVQLSQNLANYGIQTIEMRPTIKNFSPAMKELQDAVLSGRFHHDGNPTVAWAVGNITVKPDAAGNIYPAKPHGNSKIDPGVALIMAIARAMVNQPNTSPLTIRWL
jgi:phage terminase large subunit-like protein